jgi:hypothetical protein
MTQFDKRVAKSLGRHLVTLSCVQQVPNDPKEYLPIISGFIVEVLEQWFFVTAGHVITDIRDAVNAGATFDVWRFSDYTAKRRI